jgi:response regulator RpfG family c-di-GMP phosphodiesterase
LPGKGGSRKSCGVPVSRKERLILLGAIPGKGIQGVPHRSKNGPAMGSPEKKQRKGWCGNMNVQVVKRTFAGSVSVKVFSLLAVAVLLAVFASLVVMHVLVRERLTDDLRSRAEASARLLASMLAEPLARSAERDVEELVRVYAERSDVPVVAVLLRSFGDGFRGGSGDGGKTGGEHAAEAERVVTGFVRQGERFLPLTVPPDENALSGDGKPLRVLELVPGEVAPLGTVEVYVSQEELRQDMRRHLLIHGTAAVFFVCVLLGVLFLSLEQVVFTPLRHLAEAVKHFRSEAEAETVVEGAEERVLPEPAPVVVAADEFGDLAATFRELSETLQQSFAQRDRLLRELRWKNNLLVLEAAARDKALQEVDATQRELVLILGEVVETRSADTANHVRRVGEYAWLLGRCMGLRAEAADLLRVASPLHDVGKIGIPDAVLNKPGPLTPEEFNLVKTHTLIGNRLLGSSPRRIFRMAANVALQHHERWDGRGYPEGRRGEEIDLFARITCVADVFDALTHRRVYKDAWPLEETLAFLRQEKERHFDPQVVDCFFASLEEILAVFRAYPDD